MGVGGGRGQPRQFPPPGGAAGLAGRMPASWRDDCHAAGRAACRRGTAESSQRDSGAAGLGHITVLCDIYPVPKGPAGGELSA